MADQDRLLARAILVSAFSVAWSLVVGGTAVAVAFVTRSPSLAGFGLDSVIDAVASVTLIWYFKARVRDPARAERMEARTLRAVGSALIVAAIYVAVHSVDLLVERSAPEGSVVGAAISAASLLVLPVVAIVKFRLAAGIHSAALRSDGVLTAGAALLGGVALVAVSLEGVDGAWWVDPAAALVIAAVLAAEGVRGWVAKT
jgi:divalent metal cation (Fe/Co/Zn/Cd) transporter